MENCLLTTLKASVANDNLKLLGVNTISVKQLSGASNLAIGFQPTEDYDITIKCRDGQNHLTVDGNSVSEYTITKGSLSKTITIENADYIIDIYGARYGGIKAFQSKSDVVYSDLEDIIPVANPDKTVTFKVNSLHITGDISVLASMTGVKDLSLERCNVRGDVSIFGRMKLLTALNFAGTRISGTVERLVESWLSGTPKILNSPMMILGLPLLSFGSFESFPNAYTYLIYNNAGTKIAVYYGGTSAGYDTCPTVYIKGYKNDGTDADYNANVGSGGSWYAKTVIDATTKETWHTPA